MSRDEVTRAKRIVLKIGSSSLTRKDGRLNAAALYGLVTAVAQAKDQGQEILIVTSGAVAAGFAPLGFSRPPKDLAGKQAAAAVGQRILTEKYGALFADFGIHVAQVLLTVADLTRQSSYRNALRTLTKLLELGVVPLVNENDTVATQELRFGDNDRLAALVSHLVDADLLIVLSDVAGLYTDNPRNPEAKLISTVSDISQLQANILGSGSEVGTGGMVTKVEAAKVATSAGIPVVLAQANKVSEVLKGIETGTLFKANGKRKARRLLWLEHISQVSGSVTLDAGAVKAILENPASLLPPGIIAFHGDFHAGDPIDIMDESGNLIARGFSHYDAADLPQMIGKTTAQLAVEFGVDFAHPVVHRDHLVLLR